MPDFVREGRLFRVVSFAASHRQLLLRSDATAVDGTDTRVEVYFGHVELMLLKPIYQKGIHIRPASEAEFAVLKERHDLPAGDAGFTWMIEPGGDSFVVSAEPAWREADRKFEDPSLFDFAQPWPPDFPVEYGSIG
ncbi:hypothetical protein SAMN05446589_3906 [Streptomyces sp. OV198]|jgi:hypothetical protein|uniref:hypothetical protein n=1 Tax=unclassified Streptomyces TaxID=2593676 RepID=UPI000BB15B1F|nr:MULTISPECIES: hypothetical protein [unclassified Streptomyces]PBC97289.1 hypothetical protein BX281_5311 [Streptomyces sp. Ag82_O1-15]SOE70968.1 hypothetical protein SAMN05446589_3906 [Streptomyces sp. OV198]